MKKNINKLYMILILFICILLVGCRSNYLMRCNNCKQQFYYLDASYGDINSTYCSCGGKYCIIKNVSDKEINLEKERIDYEK